MSMKTFVINMESAKDRLKFIDKQLSSLWIDYERFPAVIWKDLTDVEVKKVYDKEKCLQTLWHELTKGEIWCSLSHMWIYKKMVNENIPIALVLEDDAIISPLLKNIFDKLNKKTEKQLANWFDYMTLNYSLINWRKFIDYVCFMTKKLWREKKFFSILVHWCWSVVFLILDQIFNFIWKKFWPFITKKYKPLYLAGWYFITLQWAKKLIWVHDKIFVQADLIQELFYKRIWLKFGCVFPLIVRQNENFQTQITWRDNDPYSV